MNENEVSSTFPESDEKFTTTTKVIYHIGDEDTPYLVKINHPSSPPHVVKLIHLKSVLNRPQYKYFFKVKDDDFGVVKEELLNDDASLPLFNGRVVCWLELSDHQKQNWKSSSASVCSFQGVNKSSTDKGNKSEENQLSCERELRQNENRRSGGVENRRNRHKSSEFNNIQHPPQASMMSSSCWKLPPSSSQHRFGSVRGTSSIVSSSSMSSSKFDFKNKGDAVVHRGDMKVIQASNFLKECTGSSESDNQGCSVLSVDEMDRHHQHHNNNNDDMGELSDGFSSQFTSVSKQAEKMSRQRRRRRRRGADHMDRHYHDRKSNHFDEDSASSVTTDMIHDIIEVELDMDRCELMGISIVGQSKSSTGGERHEKFGGGNKNHAAADCGIYVGSIMKGGAVALDGRIQPGDMLLQVNDISFQNMTNDQAVTVLRDVVQKPGPIRLVVAKCWKDDKNEPNRNTTTAAVSSNAILKTLSRNEPVRPIDPGAWVAHTDAIRALQGHLSPPASNYYCPTTITNQSTNYSTTARSEILEGGGEYMGGGGGKSSLTYYGTLPGRIIHPHENVSNHPYRGQNLPIFNDPRRGFMGRQNQSSRRGHHPDFPYPSNNLSQNQLHHDQFDPNYAISSLSTSMMIEREGGGRRESAGSISTLTDQGDITTTPLEGGEGSEKTNCPPLCALTIHSDVNEIIEEVKCVIDVRDRVWLKIKIPNSFIGCDLLDWLFVNVQGFSDRKCCKKFIVERMLKPKLIQHAFNKNSFCEQSYYVFAASNNDKNYGADHIETLNNGLQSLNMERQNISKSNLPNNVTLRSQQLQGSAAETDDNKYGADSIWMGGANTTGVSYHYNPAVPPPTELNNNSALYNHHLTSLVVAKPAFDEESSVASSSSSSGAAAANSSKRSNSEAHSKRGGTVVSSNSRKADGVGGSGSVVLSVVSSSESSSQHHRHTGLYAHSRPENPCFGVVDDLERSSSKFKTPTDDDVLSVRSGRSADFRNSFPNQGDEMKMKQHGVCNEDMLNVHENEPRIIPSEAICYPNMTITAQHC